MHATSYGCTDLSSITIPNNVTSIGNNAFANCYSLESVVIGKNVTSLGTSAFANCKELVNVTDLSYTPQSIYDGTFKGTPASKTLHVCKGRKGIYRGSLWENYFTIIDDALIEPVTPVIKEETTITEPQMGSLTSFQMTVQQGVTFTIGADMKAKIYADNKLVGEASLNDITLINGVLTINFHSVMEKSMAKIMTETINEATATELVDVRVDIEANSFSVDGTPYPYTMSYKYKAPVDIEEAIITDVDKVDAVTTNAPRTTKRIINGRMVIEKLGKQFSLSGAEMK